MTTGLSSVKVKLCTGRVDNYEYQPDTTIEDLIKFYAEKNSDPPSYYIIVYDGTKLDNEKTIESYGFDESSSLILMRILIAD